MDPSLLREREAFKKRALAVPVVEKRKAKPDDSKKERPAKKPRPAPKPKDFDYKSASGSSQYKFGILAKIVKHMRQKHQDGDNYPLTIDEVLDETNQLDIGARNKHWLITEALNNNPKIDIVEGDKYKFKPKLNIKDKKSLLRLLDKNDQRGLGGIYLDDVEEAVPRTQKVLKNLGDHVIHVQRPIDKKTVLFFNDKSHKYDVDEDLQKLWRGVTVEGVDEGKIEDYLARQGINTMQDVGITKALPIQKRKGNRKKKPMTKTKDNEHVDNVLQDYSALQK